MDERLGNCKCGHRRTGQIRITIWYGRFDIIVCFYRVAASQMTHEEATWLRIYEIERFGEKKFSAVVRDP
eukprot:scaffold1736_cov127-Cylindrotheca_fusiformis.AAC.54